MNRAVLGEHELSRNGTEVDGGWRVTDGGSAVISGAQQGHLLRGAKRKKEEPGALTVCDLK